MKGLKPLSHLFGCGAIRGDFPVIRTNVNMTLKSARTLCISDQHGGTPVMIFMCGKPNNMVWISLFQKIDLVELQLGILGRINGYTMIDCKGNIAIVKKSHHVIYVF